MTAPLVAIGSAFVCELSPGCKRLSLRSNLGYRTTALRGAR